MAFESNIAQVNISLETTAVSEAGFGTPIFASQHKWFPELVRSFSNIEEVEEVIPTDSNEYIAAAALFSADVAPSVIKIGRREVASITLDAVGTFPVPIGVTYSIKLIGTGGVESSTVSITGDGTDSAIEVATALSAVSVTGVTVTDNADGSLTLSGTAGNTDWAIDATVTTISRDSSVAGLEPSYGSPETAADMVAALAEVDDEWYMIASDDHTASFVTALATAIESRTKLYFVSTADDECLAVLSSTPTSGDIAGLLAVAQRFRTACLFHHDADTDYPECKFISRFAPKVPGTTVWTTKNIKTSVSQDPDSGNVLSTTQLGYLHDRNCNFVQSQGGVAVVREGKVAAGERIDIIRSRDFMEARLTEALQLKMINSEKIPYTDIGINEIRGVTKTVLDRYVTAPGAPNILQENNPYILSFPKSSAVPALDKINGILNASFVGYLAGAIIISRLTGKLTYENLAS